jgi:hypothetical protein
MGQSHSKSSAWHCGFSAVKTKKYKVGLRQRQESFSCVLTK